jgi:2-keto-4-pentenoate hydratase
MRANKIASLSNELLAAYRNDGLFIAAEAFADLTVEEAFAIQGAVLRSLDETVPVVKVGVGPDKSPIAAPIMGSYVVESGGRLDVPTRGLVGLEVEVAVRLRHDLTPEIAAGGVPALLGAVDQFLCGIEIVGTRFDDRAKAGQFGGLADCMTSAGYVWSAATWEPGVEVDGTQIDLLVDGRSLWAGQGKHPFGGVLAPILAYAKAPRDQFGGLRAGMIVTTGSLCGIVPMAGAGSVVARMGQANSVAVTLADRHTA